MTSNISLTYTSLSTFPQCRPVDDNVSPSWLSPGRFAATHLSPRWFVAQVTVQQICDGNITTKS